MKSVKQTVLEAISNLPEEASCEDIIEEVLFIQKIETGLKDIEEGRIHSHEEVKERLSNWLK